MANYFGDIRVNEKYMKACKDEVERLLDAQHPEFHWKNPIIYDEAVEVMAKELYEERADG